VKKIMLAIGIAVSIALILNVAGVLRYPGGPLREGNADGILWLDVRPADQGSSSSGNTAEADWAQTGIDLVESEVRLGNPWPLAATIEAITPVTPTPGFETLDVRVSRPGAGNDDLWGMGLITPDQRAIVDADYVELPVTIAPAEEGRRIAIVFRGTRAGPTGFEALAVDYRVGPIAFRVIQHIALHACLGANPVERTCPEDY
jgi:hypothetical protein